MPAIQKGRSVDLVVTFAALALAAIGVAFSDFPQSGGGIKGDEATYIGLAASVGFDGDFSYAAADYQRFHEWYGGGPEGIFLKRGRGDRLYFGKAYIYGVVAAPFARLGGVRGLLLFNLACLALVILAGYRWLRATSPRALAVAFSIAFVVASVTPLYAFWLTSETLNFALVFAAFALAVSPAGSPPRPMARQLAGLVCLGAAIFSKPLNLPLALPLALAIGSRSPRKAAGALTGIATVVFVLFATNAAISGDFNYQGGERKTFYGRFPFDEAGDAFDTAGIDLSTNTVLTPVGEEGRLASVGTNLWYFLAGRHFGLIPFGWPWLTAIALWAWCERSKTLWQWALLAAVGIAAFGTIVWMPYTWSGGGGPVGNRYFLSVAASLFFLVPPLASTWPIALSAAGLIFTWPLLVKPMTLVQQPWDATRYAVFRVLPLELTGASDFPVILDQRRGRIPQGRRPTLFVALLDDAAGMGRGGWMAVAPNAEAQLLVRSPEPLESIIVGVKSPQPCDLVLDADDDSAALTLAAGDRQDVRLAPAQTFSRDSFVFVLTVDTSACTSPIQVAMQAVSAHREN